MINELKSVIKRIEGSLLTIGLDPKFDPYIQNNDKIILSYVMEKNGRKIKGSGSTDKKTININIKKIKKIFKFKKINCCICNYSVIKSYLRHFIKNSIYITNHEIYIYGNIDEVNIKELEYRYNRYGIKIDVKISDNEFVLVGHIEDTKTRWYKNILYYIRDLGYDLFDIIGDVMAS